MTKQLDPQLERAVRLGLMTRAAAEDIDAFADGIVARVVSGEITKEEGNRLTVEQAVKDALALNRARERAGK